MSDEGRRFGRVLGAFMAGSMTFGIFMGLGAAQVVAVDGFGWRTALYVTAATLVVFCTYAVIVRDASGAP